MTNVKVLSERCGLGTRTLPRLANLKKPQEDVYLSTLVASFIPYRGKRDAAFMEGVSE